MVLSSTSNLTTYAGISYIATGSTHTSSIYMRYIATGSTDTSSIYMRYIATGYIRYILVCTTTKCCEESTTVRSFSATLSL